MPQNRVVATKVRLPEGDLQVDAKLRVSVCALTPTQQLTPEAWAGCARAMAQKGWKHWRKDHRTQVCFAWYGANVVEYFIGTAYGVAQALGVDFGTEGLDPAEIVLWILDIRPPTPEEYECRRREQTVAVENVRPEKGAEGDNGAGKVDLPKVPSLIQAQINSLIERSKEGNLSTEEEASLNELLDYLDDLTIRELRCASPRAE